MKVSDKEHIIHNNKTMDLRSFAGKCWRKSTTGAEIIHAKPFLFTVIPNVYQLSLAYLQPHP